MATIDELRAALAAAEAVQAAQDEAERTERRKAWAAVRDNPESWEWSCTPRIEGLGTFDEVPGREICTVQKRLRAEHAAVGKQEGAADVNLWRGMRYYRTDEGILTHGGGGHLVLHDPMLCNADEWAAICRGDIPAKYKR